MSQAGRGLNGGIDYVFNFLLILDYISNGNASFYVNAYGDIICHSIQIATTLTVNTITVLSGLVAPTFSNTSNTFSVDAAGLLLSTSITASTFSNASETFLADVDGNVIANSLVVYVGSLDINVGNEIVNLQETKADTSWVTNDSTGFFKTVKDWVNANFEPILDLTNIVCQTINTNTSTLSINNTLTDAVTYIKGRVGINEPNPVVGSVLHVVGSTTIDGSLGVTGSINLLGSPALNVRSQLNILSNQTNALFEQLDEAVDRFDSNIGATNVSPSLISQINTANTNIATNTSNINLANTAIASLQLWRVKGYAYVNYASGSYTVFAQVNMSFYFNDLGTGWHVVVCTIPDTSFLVNGIGLLQLQQVTTSGTNGVFKIALQSVYSSGAGSGCSWEIETFNLGGSRVNCGFQIIVF